MANSVQIVNKLNAVLNPVIHQVIGSTPETIAKNIANAGIEGKAEIGMLLAATCILAACVNKKTLEEFVATDTIAAARPAFRAALTLNGKANMTAATLLGHCLLTTSVFDAVDFVKAARSKMGVRHIWAGDIPKENLGEKQRAIITEKAKRIPATQAMLLGSGYVKYTHIVNEELTVAEASLFGLMPKASEYVTPYIASERRAEERAKLKESAPVARSSRKPQAFVPATQPSTSQQSSKPAYLSSPEAPPSQAPELTIDDIPNEVVNYYTNVLGGTPEQMGQSVARSGVAGFIQKYSERMKADPDGSRQFEAQSRMG